MVSLRLTLGLSHSNSVYGGALELLRLGRPAMPDAALQPLAIQASATVSHCLALSHFLLSLCFIHLAELQKVINGIHHVS